MNEFAQSLGFRGLATKIQQADGEVRVNSDGSIDLVPSSGDVEVQGDLDVTGTMTGTVNLSQLQLEDDEQLQFGDAPDYWAEYELANTRWRFRSADIDGMGSAGDIIRVPDGGQQVDFLGDVHVPNASYFTGEDSSQNDIQLIGVTGSDVVLVGDVAGQGLTTNLQANGTTVLSLQTGGHANLDNGNLRLNADNAKAQFGAGQDAAIYYDGTDLIVDPQEVGSGDLKLNAGGINMNTSGPILIGNDHGSSVGDESTVIGKGARSLADTGGTIANNHPRTTAVGFEAARSSNRFGLTATGYQAARGNTGIRVTATGYRAAHNNTGNYVTTTGFHAARNNTGDHVTATGYYVAENNTGSYVTATGYYAARGNTGSYVTATGYYAAQNNTGANVTAIGSLAARGDGLADPADAGARVTGIGSEALRNNEGDDVLGLGYQAGKSNTGADCVLIGRQAGENNTSANQFIVQQANVNATALIEGDFSSGKVDLPGYLALGGSDNLQLHRDAADTLALRRSSNAQELRVFNTTDGTNKEFVSLGYINTANVVVLDSEQEGTGTARPIEMRHGGTTRIQLDSTGIGFFGATPVAQQSALTAADGSTVDATYGTEERDVIQNLVTRVGELETKFTNYGLLAA